MQAAVVGVPGTGKTYFMVSYLKKHFIYDEFFHEYTIKSDVLIITNIAELKFFGSSCWNIESPEILGDALRGIAGKYTREHFFTVDNMQKIMDKTGKKNIILALDEIQKDQYFPYGYKHPDVLYLFAYHRHIGMDILLGTQDVTLVSRGVIAQCEYLAHGKLRSKKLFGAMSYRFTDNKGNYLYDKTLKTDKQVFAAYQSASVDEANKPKNAVLHWIVITAVFLIVAGGLFKTSLAMVANKAKPENARKNISPSARSLMATPGPVAPTPSPASVAPTQAGVVPTLAAAYVAPVMPPASNLPASGVPAVPSSSTAPVALASNDLPRVIGYVGDSNGKNVKYMLSTGQIFASERTLSIGDVYIR